MGLNLLCGSASKSNFWQYFHCVIKGYLIDFEIKKKVGSLIINTTIIIKTTGGVYYLERGG